MSEMKMTSDGSWPIMEDNLKNLKNLISQHPLFGTSSKFKLKLIGPNQNQEIIEMKMTSNGWWPLKEKDLKILNIKYLSKHWLDLPQILT